MTRKADPTEKDRIEDAIRAAGWDRKRAARMMGISRRTLYRRIHEHGITVRLREAPVPATASSG